MGTPHTQPAPATMLVVQDGEDTGRLCREAVFSNGCRILEVRTTAEALALLDHHRVDVVVTPQEGEVEGLHLLEAARERNPNSAGILLCQQVSTELAAEASRRAGVFRLFAKPWPEDRLRTAVRAAVDCQRTGTAAVASEGGVRAALETVLPSLPTACLHLDLRRRIHHANAAAQLLLGAPAGTLLGRSGNEVGVPCVDGAETEAGAALNLCGNRDVSRVRAWDQDRLLLWTCRAVCGEAGEYGGCEVIFEDITERGALEKGIFLAKHEIENVFDSITDPTFLVTPDFCIRRANRALSYLLNRSFGEILGRPCGEVLADAGGERLLCRVSEVFRQGQRAGEEFQRGDGTTYKIHFFPIVRTGRVRHVVVRYQDVTAEKEMEGRLLQSEKLAGVGALSAGIAHEINNPVGFISWNINQLSQYLEELRGLCQHTQALADQALGHKLPAEAAWRRCSDLWETSDVPFILEDAAAIVRECNQGIQRVQKIAADLLAYSHPSDNAWEEADLHECLESALNITHNELKYRCEVLRRFGRLPRVRCRAQRITQVFINLLVNAAHAIADRGVITLTTTAAGGQVIVTVTDTGGGIPEPIINRIFDPFFTTKPVGQGTGLGLHLAQGIVWEHGGEIRVQSQLGRGSTFSVRLPVAAEDVLREPQLPGH